MYEYGMEISTTLVDGKMVTDPVWVTDESQETRTFKLARTALVESFIEFYAGPGNIGYPHGAMPEVVPDNYKHVLRALYTIAAAQPSEGDVQVEAEPGVCRWFVRKVRV